MSKYQMLINVAPGEECRIAIVSEGQLEELYQERTSAESHIGNIYKGRVSNIEPSIQAAFIDFGQNRNGFLHISDLHPMYFAGHDKDEKEAVGQKTPHRDRPPIQKCLKRGQEILVQVLKEGIGTKGPTLTSYLSIPGRYLVMMPNMERLGVSRKVEDDDARKAARQILDELNPPEGFGFIIRTAGIGCNKTELKRDLSYLQRLWASIEQRKKKVNVGELYAESDLVIRTLRDVFSSDIDQIIIDDEQAAVRARDFLAISNPRASLNVALYNDPIPLFHRFDLERQIEIINSRTVPMPSGGYLVIDSTEALVAIDVNSGKMREGRDAEATAFKVNMEATDEICRQLRLRDLGGVIVNDLIDMHDPRHRKQIEARFKENLKRDRARTRTSPIGQFGTLEMTRQRMRPSLRKSIYIDCPHCQGAAQVKSPESVVLEVVRRLALALRHEQVKRVELTVGPSVAFILLNYKRSKLVALETQHQKNILIRVNDSGPADFVSLLAMDAKGAQIDGESLKNLDSYQLLPVEAIKEQAVIQRDNWDDSDDSAETNHDADEQPSLPEPIDENTSEPSEPSSSKSQGHLADDITHVDSAPDESPTQNDRSLSQADGHQNQVADQTNPYRKRRRRRRRSNQDAPNSFNGNTTAVNPNAREPNDKVEAHPPASQPSPVTDEHKEGSDSNGHASPPQPTRSGDATTETNATEPHADQPPPKHRRRRRGGRRRTDGNRDQNQNQNQNNGPRQDHRNRPVNPHPDDSRIRQTPTSTTPAPSIHDQGGVSRGYHNPTLSTGNSAGYTNQTANRDLPATGGKPQTP